MFFLPHPVQNMILSPSILFRMRLVYCGESIIFSTIVLTEAPLKAAIMFSIFSLRISYAEDTTLMAGRFMAKWLSVNDAEGICGVIL